MLAQKEHRIPISNRHLIFDKIATASENNDIHFWFLLICSLIILKTSFFFNTPVEIFHGLIDISTTESTLISDYFILGSPGAAFFNSGILMIISLFIIRKSKVHINGSIVATVFTVAGFAFFGKNIFNIWPILAGVYLYSFYKKEPFKKFILVALFGTGLAPLVSVISLGVGFSLPVGIILGIIMGIIAGFILPSLANHMVKFHQGYNIYNIGFTAGMVGSLFMALMRSFRLENQAQYHVATGFNSSLSIFLGILFVVMILTGFVFNNLSFKGFTQLLQHSGRLVTDFVNSEGLGISLINMGVMGLLSTGYVLLVGGEINGPILGGIFTIVGFSAFGKHPKNVIPILMGVYLACQVQHIEVAAPAALLAALFGTTLAPISGEFGIKAGLLAGFIHTAVVMNIGYLHGGINLYNNGFAGGMVAAILIPVLNAFLVKE